MVHRHIGGLEKQARLEAPLMTVHRHIGGLEIPNAVCISYFVRKIQFTAT